MEKDDPENAELLKYEDFECLRCHTCKKYLTGPNIMRHCDPTNIDNSYMECGECYIVSVQDGNSPMPIRSTSTEVLAAITPFPCKYYSNGCRERRTHSKLKIHEEECVYRVLSSPLFKEEASLLSGVEIIKKYKVEYPNLILHDGVITLAFDKDFEQPFLIHQNTDLFVCRVKYDVATDKAWFTVSLLENRKNTECSIEFSDVNLKETVTLKIIPNPEGMTMTVDIKAIRSLLHDNTDIKCRLYLNMRLLTPYPAQDLLKEIQCPTCWDYMTGRIFVCSNGHSICSECKKSSKFCPVCRNGELESIRNFSLERIISQGFFPCKNYVDGCSYICTLDEVICHQVSCKFNVAPENVVNRTLLL